MFRKPKKRPPDHKCPNCGEWVRGGAQVCRECGASDDSGWGDASTSSEGDWYEADDDESEDEYQEFLRKEFPKNARPSRSLAVHWWWTAFVVLLCIFYFLFGGLF